MKLTQMQEDIDNNCMRKHINKRNDKEMTEIKEENEWEKNTTHTKSAMNEVYFSIPE